jgi:hypothetical protein
MKAVVLWDSRSADAWRYRQLVAPYLDHFGVAYAVADTAGGTPAIDWAECPLLVLAHTGLMATAEGTVAAALAKGTGVVCFDPEAARLLPSGGTRQPPMETHRLRFAEKAHWIAERHAPGEDFELYGIMELPGPAIDPACVLIAGHDRPLLAAGQRGPGRLAVWTSQEWMLTTVLGPMGGLDDCLWRSLVWAARKPFVMRPLAPMVTMRVDDVAAWGGLFGRSPLHWVDVCNRHGLKPWLGLLVYNLDPVALVQLKGLEQAGLCSSFPHALGRPVRAPGQSHYYYPGALPPRAADYDEFIYFDHHNRRPWSDAEAKRGLAAVDEWYRGPGVGLRKFYAVCHWYEHASNTLPHIRNAWGVEFVCATKDTDVPYSEEVPWLKSGPFRLHEEPGACAFTVERRGVRPVYYADFVEMAGQRFFNCVTEIRDDAGYEWAPDRDVAASVGRGVRQIRRALDSLALASLFTHETDYIFRIPPDQWEQEIRAITEGVSAYGAAFLTVDEALPVVRAHRTSGLEGYRVASDRAVTAEVSGQASVATSVTVYTEHSGAIAERRVAVPPFAGRITVHA